MPGAAPAALEQLMSDLIAGGSPRDADLALFSDLTRPAASWLREHWLDIPVETRADILARATDAAEDDVTLNFLELGRAALGDPDPEVRERAVLSLWETDDRDVAARLAALLDGDPAPGVRAAAAANLHGFVALHELGRLPGTEGERAIASARRAYRDAGEPVEVRAAALEALGPCSQPWVADLIADAYDSGDRPLRVSAVRAMGASGLDRWTEYLADQLYSDDEELRLEAAVAAGTLGSEDLVPPLGELLADEDFDVVYAAIEALGEIGGEEAAEILGDFRQSAPAELIEAVDLALEIAARGGLFRRFGDLASP